MAEDRDTDRAMRILIAEDDAVSRRILETVLAKWGYEVVSAAADGARVVEAAGDRDVFGLMQRMLEEFVESEEDAAEFAGRAGSVVEALAHARNSEAIGAGEAVG